LSLLVALYSLSRVYTGRVHVVFGPVTPRWLFEEIDDHEGITCSLVKERYHDNLLWDGRQREWWEKPHIIRNESPFTNTLYYDTDHVFFDTFDESIFEEIERHKLVNPCRGYPRTEWRILRIMHSDGIWDTTGVDAPPPLRWQRSNGGCIGVHKHGDTMDALIRIMNVYLKAPFWRLQSNAEELALGTLVNSGAGKQVSDKWSRDSRETIFYSRRDEYREERALDSDVKEEGALAVHYSGKTYRRCKEWTKVFIEACQHDFLGIATNSDEVCSPWPWVERALLQFLLLER
jgi:hypothetical protein